jgi:membrane associated rhomboid family serine protease
LTAALVLTKLKGLRRIPYATIALIFGSVAFFCFSFLPVAEPFSYWLLFDPTGRFVLLLIHPIVHIDFRHLVGNMIFGIAILGTLIESWMVLVRRRVRYGILVFCYASSLGVSALVWKSPFLGSLPAVGSSGLIFAALPFPIFYSLQYRDRIRFKGWNVLAAIGLAIVSAFLIVPIALAPHAGGYTCLDVSTVLHLMPFLASLVVADFLFDRIH